MAALLTTIEQSAYQALVDWLSTQFDPWDPTLRRGTAVSARWPTKDLPPRAITILQAGTPRDELFDPRKTNEYLIHTTVNAAPVSATTATDVATSITRLNILRASYEAHRVSIGDDGAHVVADATNALTAPVASNQATAVALATDLRSKVGNHLVFVGPHAAADTARTLAALPACTAGTLVAYTNSLYEALRAHYAARIDAWTVRARRIPVQLDVWTAYETDRDDIEARLDAALNTGTPAGTDTVRQGCLVPLSAGGWAGYADFLFDAPRRVESPDPEKRNEYRLTYSGNCDVSIEVRAQSARMASVAFAATLSSALPAPDGTPTKTITVTADETTISGS